MARARVRPAGRHQLGGGQVAPTTARPSRACRPRWARPRCRARSDGPPGRGIPADTAARRRCTRPNGRSRAPRPWRPAGVMMVRRASPDQAHGLDQRDRQLEATGVQRVARSESVAGQLIGPDQGTAHHRHTIAARGSAGPPGGREACRCCVGLCLVWIRTMIPGGRVARQARWGRPRAGPGSSPCRPRWVGAS
jgi:hypothetical protein